ncbi:formylglycine-generating enzyme family protein [Ornithinimicrobium sp. F0845]|uniref:formylglycine-generating enzyme family protein n=1 Tax=Ornithinimicrobium sp. F0845 TaxID=2926412 RepID=UPI001FF6DE63|nr:formylglycine-generating enzyme family protein [Ornithinimicrobium sp. F0845]MCK0111630.1 formylglycine-generating enzyme family protein [Ornithinimicrobium sp. F0845]
MVDIRGGSFRMGSEEFYPDERPVHDRVVADFALDRYAVTNAGFAAFVAATGYVTVAERPLDPAGFPDVYLSSFAPGALVFTPTQGPVDLSEWRQWWRWVAGACWYAPEGPGSSIEHRMQHPVVQIAFEDAATYAAWAGKRLPTEAEYEYAARGGYDGLPYAWGAVPYPDGRARANTWLGRFPYDNRGRFGANTSPVGSYPANEYGLFDLIGNVWEWTSDFYTSRHVVPGSTGIEAGPRANLLSALNSEPGSSTPRRTLKGGSYLCSPDYCLRFRPAARSPQAEDTATTHIGFRCAR